MITIQIETDNDAFARDLPKELYRVLNDAWLEACALVAEGERGRESLRDINGNRVGYVEVAEG